MDTKKRGRPKLKNNDEATAGVSGVVTKQKKKQKQSRAFVKGLTDFVSKWEAYLLECKELNKIPNQAGFSYFCGYKNKSSLADFIATDKEIKAFWNYCKLYLEDCLIQTIFDKKANFNSVKGALFVLQTKYNYTAEKEKTEINLSFSELLQNASNVINKKN